MLTYRDFFTGIGGFKIALQELVPTAQCYSMSEIDKYANKVLEKRFAGIINLGDIKDINPDTLEPVDLIMGGFPCFTEGTSISTKEGYKDIKDIEVNDLVLTHTNRFKKVIQTGINLNAPTYLLKAQGIKTIEVTEDHPFLCKQRTKLRSGKRIFSEAKWTKVKDMNRNSFIGLPIISTNTDFQDIYSDSMLWLFGRFIADGHSYSYKRKNRNNSFAPRVVFNIGYDKVKEFEDNCAYELSTFTTIKEPTVKRYIWSKKEKYDLFNQFGHKAENKCFPMWIMLLPKNKLEIVFNGYMSGDGCHTNNKYNACSINPLLIQQINLIVAKIYNTGSTFHECKRKPTTTIEGRIVNQRTSYSTSFSKIRLDRTTYHVSDDIIWYPVKEIIKTNKNKTVYNFTVDEDNSYIANNVIVHNCTNLSIQRGKGRLGLLGEQSGLFYHILNILKKSPPKYFLIENVASMSKANKALITEMLGVEPIQINSGLLSAQNRERLYWCNWKVPIPEDKGLTLMDIKIDDDFKYAYAWSKSYRPAKNDKPVSFDERIRFDGKANSLTTSINGTESLNFYTKEPLTFKPRKVFNRYDMLPYNLGEKGKDWRPINLIECARLQTFPDNWCEGLSNHQQYKRFGNAVTKDVVKYILTFCPGVKNV